MRARSRPSKGGCSRGGSRHPPRAAEAAEATGQIRAADPCDSSSGSPASWSKRAAIRKPKSLRARRSTCNRTLGIGDDAPTTVTYSLATRQYSDPAAQNEGGRRRLCGARQGDRTMGAPRSAKRSSSTARASNPLRLRPGRSWDCRGRGIGQAADRPHRRQEFRHRGGARHARDRLCARRARRRRGPRIQSLDPSCWRRRARTRTTMTRPCGRPQRPAAANRRSLHRRAAAQPQRCLNDVAIETFALADAIRGQAVQKALADSSARAVAKDPGARRTRPHRAGSAPNRSAPSSAHSTISSPCRRRSATTAACARSPPRSRSCARSAKPRGRRSTKRFPSYADLIDPKPPTVDEIKAALRPGEALLSFYFGQDASFVWAVPKDGAVAFAAVPATAVDLEAKVRRAAPGARAADRDDRGNSALRSRSSPTSSMVCCSSRSKPAGRPRRA